MAGRTHFMSLAHIALAMGIAATLPKPVPAQKQRPDCPTVLATFLTMVAGQDDPPDQRERFEFHECPGRGIQLQAFERGHASSTLVSEMFSFPAYLFQSLNVLAFQSTGGSSDQVYVFAFQKGHPRLVTQTATQAQMQVRLNENGDAVIEIPVTHGRGEQRRTELKRYVIPVEIRSPNNPSGRRK
jgi:hypothetical protein